MVAFFLWPKFPQSILILYTLCYFSVIIIFTYLKKKNMKKILLLAIVCTSLSLTVKSQVNEHAIGLRLGGGNYGNGSEISYQHGFGDVNRLELDLGWGKHSSYSRIGFTGVYQWVFNLNEGLNWYVGAGAQVLKYSYESVTVYNNQGNAVIVSNGDDGVRFGIGGQIGLEYDFSTLDVPLLVGIDTRPMFSLNGSSDRLGWGAALSVRYLF